MYERELFWINCTSLSILIKGRCDVKICFVNSIYGLLKAYINAIYESSSSFIVLYIPSVEPCELNISSKLIT